MLRRLRASVSLQNFGKKSLDIDQYMNGHTLLFNQLCQLRDETEFRVADFERFVDSVRDTVSRHLHNLILEKSDLKQELNLVVRDVFLLGRGELFQAFIEEADKYLKNPPTGLLTVPNFLSAFL